MGMVRTVATASWLGGLGVVAAFLLAGRVMDVSSGHEVLHARLLGGPAGSGVPATSQVDGEVPADSTSQAVTCDGLPQRTEYALWQGYRRLHGTLALPDGTAPGTRVRLLVDGGSASAPLRTVQARAGAAEEFDITVDGVATLGLAVELVADPCPDGVVLVGTYLMAH